MRSGQYSRLHLAEPVVPAEACTEIYLYLLDRRLGFLVKVLQAVLLVFLPALPVLEVLVPVALLVALVGPPVALEHLVLLADRHFGLAYLPFIMELSSSS